MRAACRAGVREAFATVWGDDGMECDLFSILPGVARFADLAYGRPDATPVSLRGAAGINLDDWLAGSGLDWLPGIGSHECTSGNFSKVAALDRSDPRFPRQPYPSGCHPILRGSRTRLGAISTGEPASRRLAFPALVAETLAMKLLLRKQWIEACSSRDKSKVLHLLDITLPAALRETAGPMELSSRPLA